MRLFALTWLPSFCQKTAGWGFPLVSHGKVAVRPWATIWSLGRMTNWGAAEGKNTSVSRPVVYSEAKHQGWRLSGLGNFKQKTNNIHHGQIKMGVPYRASMQRYISVSLSNGSEQRKNTNVYHCHGNQVGHSSRWGWSWMNVSHVGIHARSALVTMAFRSKTTQRHTHALETSKSMNR